MASASNKTETVTVDIAPAMDPIDTITEESVEEEDSESNGDAQDSDVSDGEDEEDSQSDGDSIVDDRDSTDDKPEWGVDSYDESKYCSLMKTLGPTKKMNEKPVSLLQPRSSTHILFFDNRQVFKFQIWASPVIGFSCRFRRDRFLFRQLVTTGVVRGLSLSLVAFERSPVTGRTQLQYTQDMAKLCLRKYNALNETDVKMDHVVRVTESFSGSWVSYITFMARESEEEATLVEYQAKAVKNLGRKSYPIFCRPSPKQDHDM
ncbi:hypothetical protein Bca101_018893 [Brassica carinata]